MLYVVTVTYNQSLARSGYNKKSHRNNISMMNTLWLNRERTYILINIACGIFCFFNQLSVLFEV